MRISLAWVVTASALALGCLTVACGDDGSAATDTPDGGGSSSSSSSGGPDAGGCTFSGYVIGLVSGSTNATASPDTTLGQSCAPATSQDEFKSLFP